MILTASKSNLLGKIRIPASKSHTIRAVAIAALACGKSYIRNPLYSSDAISAADAYRSLGAKVDTSEHKCWVVEGVGGKPRCVSSMIDVGNSGTTLRLAAGSAALLPSGESVIFTGDKQIQQRLIAPLLGSLNDLGAVAQSVGANGYAPIKVGGLLKGGSTEIECMTSQYLSSLLMCCPLAQNDSSINATLLNEPDYVKITTDWLDWQGIKYSRSDDGMHYDVAGGQKYQCFDKEIPADFSSATFLLAAAAMIGKEVVIEGLNYSDSQPDKAVVDYLCRMGADIEIDGNQTIVRASKLQGIDIDMNRTPDALPMMAVVGAFADGVTRLLNVPQARKKETDRIACMALELMKMGGDIEELPDGLVVRRSKLSCAAVNGHYDHRIVMALAIAGLLVEGATKITTAEAMSITFPNFVDIINSLGGNLTVLNQ